MVGGEEQTPEELESVLARSRWGLRFTAKRTERQYRSWYVRHAIPFTRVGMIASVIAWIVTFTSLAISGRETVTKTGWLTGLAVVIVLASLGTTYRERWISWVIPTTAFANAVAGLCILSIGILAEISAGLLTGGLIIVSYFAFTVFRMPPWLTGCAVLTYIGPHEVRLFHNWQAGQLPYLDFIWCTALAVIAVSTGFFVTIVVDRILRDAFVQERVIESQRRTIEHERARADRLLHSILPAPIVEKLKDAPTVIAERFDEVTVLFADVVGFTPLAARVEPEELVRILDGIFTRFDELAEAHGVEKIKTIGDAYMAVAGVPEARSDHAVAAAELAIAMRSVILEQRQGVPPIELRIGLCTGPVVAGVIGARKFAYDLWGDTVNTASRMEAHGVARGIQVSESTYEKLREHYRFEKRGTIEIKGKGLLPTWLLLEKNTLAVDEERQAV